MTIHRCTDGCGTRVEREEQICLTCAAKDAGVRYCQNCDMEPAESMSEMCQHCGELDRIMSAADR